MTKIKLTKEQSDIFKSGNMISTLKGTYWNYPYWIKESNGEYYIIEYKDLPEDIKKIAKEMIIINL